MFIVGTVPSQIFCLDPLLGFLWCGFLLCFIMCGEPVNNVVTKCTASAIF